MNPRILLLAFALGVTAPVAAKKKPHAPTAKQMGMTEEEHKHMHDLPPGNGAAEDGTAWLKPEVTGEYWLHNFELQVTDDDRVTLKKGEIYFIKPHIGPAVWTRPDGVREVVPTANLIKPKIKF